MFGLCSASILNPAVFSVAYQTGQILFRVCSFSIQVFHHRPDIKFKGVIQMYNSRKVRPELVEKYRKLIRDGEYKILPIDADELDTYLLIKSDEHTATLNTQPTTRNVCDAND